TLARQRQPQRVDQRDFLGWQLFERIPIAQGQFQHQIAPCLRERSVRDRRLRRLGDGSPPVSTRDDALVEIVALVRQHGLTVGEIASALDSDPHTSAARSSGILSRGFGYLGGTFVFAGLALYIGMRWDDLGSTGRVLLTLGPGFCAFVLALVCTTKEAFAGAALPLFLIAALVHPTGILVMMNEFSRGG